MTARKKGVGRSDRYPSDYGVRDLEAEKEKKPAKNKSWSPGDNGQGREGYSKGYGGSGGEGTGPSGPDRKK
jgi:hypothetical protein